MALSPSLLLAERRILKAHVRLKEDQDNIAGRSVALLADDQLGFNSGPRILSILFVVATPLPINEDHDVCILFNGARLTQVPQFWTPCPVLLGCTAQLGQCQHWNV